MSEYIQASMTDVVMIEKKRVPDGEGGLMTEWREGAIFKASIGTDDSIDVRVAQKQGVTSLYIVTTAINAILRYHDVFKRISDGKIFRVTSDGDDIQTPPWATIGPYAQVTAEEWELPAT